MAMVKATSAVRIGADNCMRVSAEGISDETLRLESASSRRGHTVFERIGSVDDSRRTLAISFSKFFAAPDALHDHPAVPYRNKEQQCVGDGHSIHSPRAAGSDDASADNANHISGNEDRSTTHRKTSATACARDLAGFGK